MKAALLALISVAAAASAHAAPRTFVASYGVNTNPCSVTAPCRSFSVALSHTDPAGEVIVLDSAGYGPIAISQSVSIIAPRGVYAGISVFSGAGVSVNGSAIDVTLRGLTINGQGPGTVGVEFGQGARLVVDGCAIRNMGTNGVTLSAGRASISSSSITRSTDTGLRVEADVIATIVDSRIESNGSYGVWLFEGANVTIERSVIAKNVSAGVNVYTGSNPTVLAISSSVVADHASATGVFVQPVGLGTSASVDVSSNTLVRNDTGIHAGAATGVSVKVNASNNQISDSATAAISAQGVGATVRASGNSMFRGQYGILTQFGGIIYSPGNNYVRDNSTDDSAHTADSML